MLNIQIKRSYGFNRINVNEVLNQNNATLNYTCQKYSSL
uniref:Uncharacterized protein n=1 Tax=Arundo donax TaxID=35708 RepID=A0A0A8Z0U8_ARUDO